MTFNPERAWTIEGDHAVLRSALIGQEFIVEANDGIVNWLADVFRNV